ncbi:NADH-quinone oxidoreductase subunit N [Taylorella equigenitalis 14/56]|uniref:NADH-quinone oxidoreductase subunit N n=1 Tax=Taylorella equigenitalis 14/56 TaxID=1091497 RepID=I7JIM5_9BURK|nr:NADH-quinone oxidoreductase subunit NuoN [Taylorella equigenitalis]CCG17416.1 NADH-quinone oxidoreductase subunit N [Taylorella equigenitalis 14/56]
MDNQFNYVLALPEIILCVFAILILLSDAFFRSVDSVTSYLLSIGTLVLTLVVTLFQWTQDVSGLTFYNNFIVDSFAHFLKVCSIIAVLVTFIYGRRYVVERHMVKGGEFYSLALFALLGQFVMISASSMLTIYLGLELMSLSLYALVAVRRDSLLSIESAMKYYVLGSLASGFMLYGISLLYGSVHGLGLAQMASVLASGEYHPMAFYLGMVFVVAGIAFKLGAVPFHMWLPDVYGGAPTIVTLTIASAPKLAAFAMAMRFLIEGMHTLHDIWQPMLIIMAVLSLVIGNLTAIMQTNFKRMLAYSTISHIGFVLLGLLSGVADDQLNSGAYGSALFYIIIYVLTTLATFGVILFMSNLGFEADEISDLAGLNKRCPLLAFAILLLMFSLAGIPPLVGFYSKLVVLQAVLSAGYVSLTVVAVIFSLIGAFYYLRVVKTMYFDEPPANPVPLAPVSAAGYGIFALNSALIVLLGITPGWLMSLCVQVIDQSLRFTN